jgi:hypothetical protein
MIGKSLGSAGGEAALSKRWLVDAKCRRLGWVMVPYDAADKLTNSIADAFDEFEDIILDQKIVVHPMLLNRIESLEKAMIEKLCELANSWRKTRIEKFEQARIEVVTNKVALAIFLESVVQLFARLDAKISDYNLIDIDAKEGELVFCAIECLDERVTEDVTKIVRGWK